MWLVLVIFVLTLLYYVVQRQYNYWSKKGIPGPRPLPLVGNMGDNIIGRTTIGEIVTDIYRKYEKYPFVGVYKTGPCLLVRDTDFIKNIMVKDFQHFQDNEIHVDKKTEPLFGRNPFAMRGEDWRKTRVQWSPCFTSGKMKVLFPLIDEVAKRMVKYVENSKEATSVGLEAKELCSKFTIDNVAICSFGLEANAFEDSGSQFGDLARRFVPVPSLKLFLLLLIPPLANITSAKLVPKDVEDKIIDMIKATSKYRKDNNIVRNDVLDFINDKSETNPDITDLDVAALASTFLGDGFETSSYIMSFILLELALNPNEQEKLRQEINNYFPKNFNYETLQEMTYLDACINESLRKNAPLAHLTKVCTQKYTYTPSNPDFEKISVTIDPGTPVIIPLQGLHSDPKYFDSPEKYMPERFLNKEDIHKFSYMPFGEGPRVCIGKRFGLLQVKIGLVHLVKNFELKLNPKTKLPFKFDPRDLAQRPLGGIWLNLYKK